MTFVTPHDDATYELAMALLLKGHKAELKLRGFRFRNADHEAMEPELCMRTFVKGGGYLHSTLDEKTGAIDHTLYDQDDEELD